MGRCARVQRAPPRHTRLGRRASARGRRGRLSRATAAASDARRKKKSVRPKSPPRFPSSRPWEPAHLTARYISSTDCSQEFAGGCGSRAAAAAGWLKNQAFPSVSVKNVGGRACTTAQRGVRRSVIACRRAAASAAVARARNAAISHTTSFVRPSACERDSSRVAYTFLEGGSTTVIKFQ